MDVTIERTDAGAKVRLVGRFDINSSMSFRNAIRPLLAEDEGRTLSIDLEQVDFIDSSGLGLLLLVREEAQRGSKNVVLAGCRPRIRKILSVAQFSRLFRIE